MYSGPTKEHAGHIKRMHFQGWSNPYSISEGGYEKIQEMADPQHGRSPSPYEKFAIGALFYYTKDWNK
jgi:hypothetical protein